MGAGIFVVIGVAAGLAGPALLISLVVAGAISTFTALSFAELASAIPKEGGVYEFAHELLPPPVGFISGWLWLLSNAVAGVVVALGFASYLVVFLPPLPKNAVATLVCLFVTAVNYFGVRRSSLLNNALVVAKIGILLIFVLLGLTLIRSENFTPFAPNGLEGILRGTALIFFAYGGFARITTLGEEVRDPRRTIPLAMLLSLGISAAVYLLVGFTSIGLVGYRSLAASGSPLAEASAVEGPFAVSLTSTGALMATLSVLLTTLLGLSRVAFAMSRNRDLPRALSKIHSKRKTPHASILALGLLMAVLAYLYDFTEAVALSNFALILYYAIGNYSALKLKTRLYPLFVPVAGLSSCLILLPFLTFYSWISGLAAVLVGLIYYYAKAYLSRPSS